MNTIKYCSRVFIISIFILLLHSQGHAQAKTPMIRMAKIDINPADLENYKALLKEEIETSIRIEPGVLNLYAVSEKKNPARITIFENYVSVEAYQSHIKSPHFIKYKTGTEKMVKSLELIECDPISPGMKNQK